MTSDILIRVESIYVDVKIDHFGRMRGTGHLPVETYWSVVSRPIG